MKKQGILLLIAFTLLPLILLAALHFSIKTTQNTNMYFERKYVAPPALVIKEINNPGIAEIKRFNNQYFGSNYRKIYRFDPAQFKLEMLFESANNAIISWHYIGTKLFVTINNEKQIISVEGTKQDTVFKSAIPISKNLPLNDTAIVFSSYDPAFANEEYYLHSLLAKRAWIIPSAQPKLNDGGFASDGQFIDADHHLVHLQYNMGEYTTMNKQETKFSGPYTTIDSNLKPPHVIKFGKNGYRIDSKAHPINLFGFAQKGILYVGSNVYSIGDYKNDYADQYYLIDKYSLDNHQYLESLRVPKNQLKYGRLNSAIIHQDHLILIYKNKILITTL